MTSDEPDGKRGLSPPGAGTEGGSDGEGVPQIQEPPLWDLIKEVYGAEADRFLTTPRQSLGGRTPAEAILGGDREAVREVVLKAMLGDWS